MNPIGSISTPGAQFDAASRLGALSNNQAQSQEDAGGFKNLLIDSIQNVNTMQVDADKAVEAMFTGEDVNPAEVLTAVQKADLAFRLTMQMRNKVMDVYREIQEVRI
ncbi:flagellar hook-basal body protein FliE [Pseudobythopirellula maris]|uniref:Flagellar hook-basal body complex protein FliE n=1 Tax=Pseudobythopirellula maris TaxID=2527991 RepID=A0A5C5ZGS7_9BACT|nr:flagellar hook-basal body complex protein FliE [Pseudobythopirellula maris]TWT86524.1 flagellar hook-basal body protein FliE [Pseudobythopirellula maris]